jgi:tetratricopeptide (TPR) repeat protein
MEQEVDEGQLLREHLFDGDLLKLPAPEEGLTGFLPAWYQGELAALVYPPLSDRGVEDGGNIDLQITPYHLYYGALRELAETADEERSQTLKRLVLEWNSGAALEVCQLGRVRIEEDVEAALLHYELALELDPAMYEAAQDGGMCQYALSAVPGEDQAERLASAEELFRRAIEIQPEAGLSWWSLARTVNDHGSPEAATALLHQFLEEYPRGEQRDIVEQALEQGFEAGPEETSDEQAVFAQAQALAFGEDPAAAVELLRPLAESYPDSGEIWFVLGAAHRRSGESGEAERCLRRAARLAPGEPFVWWELSQVCADLSEWQPAEEAVRKALELDPQNAIYLSDLGRILLEQGDRDGAEEAIEEARELAPDDPSVQEAVAALQEKSRA